jgi:hypothetical protein
MMALRFVLVGLVASMGFEMPSGGDVESWTRTGQNWFEARLAELSSLRLEASRAFDAATDCERADASAPAPVPAVEVASVREDLTFEAVVDGMAKDFTADLASINEPRPAEEAIATVEPFREMPEAAPSPSPSPAPAIESVVEARPEPVVSPATSRVEKISTALRLTRQAMSAWAALIQPSVVEVAGEEQTDVF